MSIVITGSPGVGKHTIAAILARKLKLELIDLNSMAIDTRLVGPDGEVDTEELADRVDCRLQYEDKLVVGHLAPWAVRKEWVKKAIVLRRSPYELEGVYEERVYPIAKRLANLGSEILGGIAHDTRTKFGARATRQIDTTGKEPEEAASLALKALKPGYTGDEVDWLGMIDRRGDMQRFFSY